MAMQSPVESLHSEATCSICLGYFQDPVSIHCGHNFCQACITRCWEGLESHFSCPQCRQTALQKNFRPSRELANIAKIARQLSLRAGEGAAGWENLCRQHQEALKLFCKDDQQPICMVCDRSQAHRFHTVVPVEEAAQEYKVKPGGTCLHLPTSQKIPFQGQSTAVQVDPHSVPLRGADANRDLWVSLTPVVPVCILLHGYLFFAIFL